ncbi:MAG: alpha/beta hydrolase [Bacillota bacterium]
MTMGLGRERRSRRSTFDTVVGVLILISAGLFTFVRFAYDAKFRRLEAPVSPGYLRFEDVPEHAPRIVKFESGKNTLTGYMFGERNDKGLVVIAHGRGFGAEDYLAEALYFVDKGWRVFAFDNTGTYSSEGDSEVGLPQAVLDLDAALTYLEGDPGLSSLPVMLFGHSWGAYASTAVLNYGHDVAAVVSVSGFNSPMGMFTEEMKRLVGPLAFAAYPFGWAYQAMLFGSAVGLTAVDGINRSEAPVMIVHGSADESVSYDGASIISQRDHLTNPNVIYRTCDTEGRNTHNTLLKSEVAVAYASQANAAYMGLFDQYNGHMPDDAEALFHESLDRFCTSGLNADLFEEINRFFEAHIAH